MMTTTRRTALVAVILVLGAAMLSSFLPLAQNASAQPQGGLPPEATENIPDRAEQILEAEPTERGEEASDTVTPIDPVTVCLFGEETQATTQRQLDQLLAQGAIEGSCGTPLEEPVILCLNGEELQATTQEQLDELLAAGATFGECEIEFDPVTVCLNGEVIEATTQEQLDELLAAGATIGGC